MSFNSLLHNFRSALAPSRGQRNHRRSAASGLQTESHGLHVEALENRSMLSAVALGDFNNDGLMDMAALTNSTTITVSLAKPDGSYIVSATLTAPKALPMGGFNVGDYNGDGNLDIRGGGSTSTRFYGHTWLGNGDGTFGDRDTQKGGHFRPGW